MKTRSADGYSGVVIAGAARTPVGVKLGTLSGFSPEDLAVLDCEEAIGRSGIERQKISHQCVLTPRDPVSCRTPKRSAGPFGPHISKRYGFLWRRRRIWCEEPIVTQLLAGTKHAHLTDGSSGPTSWASSEIRGW